MPTCWRTFSENWSWAQALQDSTKTHCTDTTLMPAENKGLEKILWKIVFLWFIIPRLTAGLFLLIQLVIAFIEDIYPVNRQWQHLQAWANFGKRWNLMITYPGLSKWLPLYTSYYSHKWNVVQYQGACVNTNSTAWWVLWKGKHKVLEREHLAKLARRALKPFRKTITPLMSFTRGVSN